MKNLSHPLLAMAAPLLVVLSLVALLQRQGRDRLQAVPAVVVGAALSVSGAVRRHRRRRDLLSALRSSHLHEE